MKTQNGSKRVMNQLRALHQALLDAARRKAEAEHNHHILTLLKGETVGKEGLPQASIDEFLGFTPSEVHARFDSKTASSASRT